MTTRSLAVLGALATLALLVSGCGGSTTPSVASVGTTSSAAATTVAGGAPGSPPSQAQLQQSLLRYAECMRASGVPRFPDPGPGGGFAFDRGSGVDPSSPAFEAAQAKCEKLMPGGGPPGPGSTTHPTAAWLAHMDEVARCMRTHGVPDFPDPTTTMPPRPAGGGLISIIDGAILVFPAATIDPQSPTFVRAAKACGFPLHNR